ncbi:membrane protein [Helicobacter pylori J99]|nr:membrane protein [Helicobacter pylori J99]
MVKFVLNSAIIGRSMFFSVFYFFGMACSSLLWGRRFLTPPYFE